VPLSYFSYYILVFRSHPGGIGVLKALIGAVVREERAVAAVEDLDAEVVVVGVIRNCVILKASGGGNVCGKVLLDSHLELL